MKRYLYLLFCVITSIITIGVTVNTFYQFVLHYDKFTWWGSILYWIVEIIALSFAFLYNASFWLNYYFVMKEKQIKK